MVTVACDWIVSGERSVAGVPEDNLLCTTVCTVVTVACDGADVRGRGVTMPSPFGLAWVCQFTAPYVLGYRAEDGRSFDVRPRVAPTCTRKKHAGTEWPGIAQDEWCNVPLN